MAACAQCGVTMTTNERNYNKRGVAAALHNDCAELEDMLAKTHPGEVSQRANIQTAINHLSAKKQGTPTQFP